MKPLEFKIEEKYDKVMITFFYGDGSKKTFTLDTKVIEKKDGTLMFEDTDIEDIGLQECNHYSIADIYGYKVIDDRKGL